MPLPIYIDTNKFTLRTHNSSQQNCNSRQKMSLHPLTHQNPFTTDNHISISPQPPTNPSHPEPPSVAPGDSLPTPALFLPIQPVNPTPRVPDHQPLFTEWCYCYPRSSHKCRHQPLLLAPVVAWSRQYRAKVVDKKERNSAETRR